MGITEVGRIIKEARERRDWSQHELGRKSGVSHSYISMIERGYDSRTKKPFDPHPLKLEALALALSIPYRVLREAAGYPPDAEPELEYLNRTATKLDPSRRDELIKLAEYFLWLQKHEKEQ